MQAPFRRALAAEDADGIESLLADPIAEGTWSRLPTHVLLDRLCRSADIRFSCVLPDVSMIAEWTDPETAAWREHVRRWRATITRYYDDRDVIIHALGVGYGSDCSPADLAFIYERDLTVPPTFLCAQSRLDRAHFDELGLAYGRLLHVREELSVHRPLPTRARLTITSSIVDVINRGENRGAYIIQHGLIAADDDPTPVASVRRTMLAREKGFGPKVESTGVTPPSPPRPPDHIVEARSFASQAAIYRLSGDTNPLHIDPEIAVAAGFPKPILHGLCTLALSVRALTPLLPAEAFVRSFAASFAAPVFPGDTLRLKIWSQGNSLAFDAESGSSSQLVLAGGILDFSVPAN